MRRALLVALGFLVAATPAHAAGKRKRVRAHLGAVRAELSYTESFGTIENGRVRIWNGNRLLVARKVGIGVSAPGLKLLDVRQLDGTGLPEVLVHLYSGGSCGCVETSVFTGAKRVKAPWIVPPTMRDADGDGKPEFHGYWGFGASWSSRADYRLPVRVWSYANGAFADVTRAFPAEVQADQADHFAEYQKRDKDGNIGGAWDALSAYVADGYTLGQGEAAMAVVQEAVDAGDLALDDQGLTGSEVLAQLRDLLRKGGYITSTAHAAAAAGARKVVRAQQGSVRAEFSYEKRGLNWERPRLRIWDGKRALVDRRFDYAYQWPRPLAVRDLDGDGTAEVMLTIFSGGNGCCFTNYLYAGAKRIKVPWLDPTLLRDADGDGKPEIHVREEAWSGWGARSSFRSPIKVWAYSGGALHNVTRSFPAEVQADQATQYAFFQQCAKAGEGGCARDAMATYVGDGYALGQGDAAMAVAQAAADADQLDGADDTGADFLDELRALLRRTGYTS
jgi:hypothetical protein